LGGRRKREKPQYPLSNCPGLRHLASRIKGTTMTSPAERFRNWEKRVKAASTGDLALPGNRARAEFWLRWFDHGFLRIFWTNQDEIAPGVWRSNQPTPARFGKIAGMGIRTIINLRGPRDSPNLRLEQDACARLGISLVSVSLNARKAPPRERLQELIGLFRSVERPVLMHCKSGADRAGLASAVWLMVIEGRSVEEARAMLSLRYIHLSHTKTGVLDAVLHAYAVRNAKTAISFEDWVTTEYDHEVIQATFDKR
jgi:protein tyrosine phosphatase (PTP) superfamily phosphohydrolase (DUF442 family)